MNKEFASLLRKRLGMLPFMDVVAGLAQTVEQKRQATPDDPITTIRYPVAYDHNAGDCDGRELDLSPDSDRRSIIFFEDFGTTPQPGQVQTGFKMKSRLRLLCWLNREKFLKEPYQDVAGAFTAAIIGRLITTNPVNTKLFTHLSIRCVGIPPQAKELFGRYTFDQATRQYLRPPYDAFGIDFEGSYTVKPGCIEWPTILRNAGCHQPGEFSDEFSNEFNKKTTF